MGFEFVSGAAGQRWAAQKKIRHRAISKMIAVKILVKERVRGSCIGVLRRHSFGSRTPSWLTLT